ncbi:polysaccharide deacetylase family protein [Peterkaempfera bronchialis]|uniref:Polysaccharide deacetylase family protein n=1 Tax=Peterkaempfera bronchialis TaxID=2126346 RepID=A0A345T5U1_9ACTN|nr:polysaccharide deacetylase family protein [Peterkaempfera bronchialis]AXI81346.1 polysaccharide deacetylase family protein [Peterkaempfera bronchialis]
MHGSSRTATGRMAGAAVLAAALTACATGAPGRAAPTGGGPAPSASPTTAGTPARPDADAQRQAAYWRAWHLTPLKPAPKPPAVPPVKLGGPGPIPVVSRIPTRDRVVFLTIDDGAEKDPRFVRMMRELKVPVTMFLTDAAIRPDYGYFTPLQRLGNTIQNHTLTHPDLPTLGAEAQRAEICGQQQKLAKEYGTAPTLFRPPYGNYNAATLEAAKSCGIRAVVLWKESMQITDMQYQTADRKLRPGDIVLAHFRGPAELKNHTMTEMFGSLLHRIQQQGFSVGRLDDYLGPPH